MIAATEASLLNNHVCYWHSGKAVLPKMFVFGAAVNEERNSMVI